MHSTLGRATFTLAASLLAAPLAAQVTAGHVDTFQDGTTQNWLIGVGPGLQGAAPPAGALPTNAPGGPGGAGDRYLELHALGGEGPGSRLAVLNFGGQWAGNYLAAGIGAIRLDARNLGSTDLSLRLLFENPSVNPPGPPTDEAISAIPILLPANSGWTSLTFPLFGPGGLVPLESSDLARLLSNTTSIRLFNLPANLPNADNGPPIVATLGVDNITAVATPEPSVLALVASGLALVGASARRRRTR